MTTKKAKSKLHRKGVKLNVTRRPGESDSQLGTRIHLAIEQSMASQVVKQFRANGSIIGELRETPKAKVKRGKEPTRLYLYVKNERGFPEWRSVFNLSNQAILNVVAEASSMFETGQVDAEEFQNLCFAELARRL